MKSQPITAADIERAADPEVEYMTWPVLRAYLQQRLGRCPGQATIYRWQNAANNPFPKPRRLPGSSYFSRKKIERWITERFACA